MWDEASKTPFFHYLVNNVTHQLWFDDHQSLEIKVAFAKKMGFMGTAVFCGDYLDPKNIPMMRQMWSSLRYQN